MSDTTVTTAPPAGTTPPAATPSLVSAVVPPSPPAGDSVVPDPTKTASTADPAKAAEPPKTPDPAPPVFALDKVKLPDGMKADDPSTKAFGDLLANDKISPLERGQALLDLYADVTKKGREAATEAWNTVNKEWETKTLADPEIGGAKWDTTKATIAKTIDSLGPALAAEVRQALDVTGAGNHPAIVKAFAALGGKLTEGRHIGGNPPTTPVSVKEAFYPNSPDMK